MTIQQVLFSRQPTPVTISFNYNNVNGDDLTEYTFSGVSIGAPSGYRRVVIGVHTYGTTVAGVTVGGIPADEIVQTSGSSGSSLLNNALYEISYPTGTSADIVVTTNSISGRTAIAVWSLESAVSATDFDSDNSSRNMSASLDVPAGGAAIAFSSCWTSSNLNFDAWGGLTEDFESNGDNSNWQYTGAHDEFTTEQTGLSITADYNSITGTRAAMVCAAWGPT